jgi:hypothetical protein
MIKKQIKNLYFIFVLLFSGLATSFYRSQEGIITLFIVTVIVMIIFNLKITRQYIYVLLGWLLYSILVTIVNQSFHDFFIARHFVFFTVAYTIYQVYKDYFFERFERHITFFAAVSLVFVLWESFHPTSLLTISRTIDISGDPFFRIKDIYNNFLIYTTTYRPEHFLQRNSGFCWEPGPFSIYLNIAIYLNLVRTNKKLKNNKALYILFIALLTTQSTTAILAFGLMILHLFYHDIKSINKNLYVVMAAGIFIYVFFTVDFMYEKILDLIESGKNIEDTIYRAWKIGKSYSGGRFGGFYIAWQDFKNYPLFGTGGSSALSYGYLDEGVGVAIINGLASVMSTYGIYGLFFYLYFGFKSSLYLANRFKSNLKYGLFIIMMISSFSFSLHGQIMLFTFVFYTAYTEENMKNLIRKSF